MCVKFTPKSQRKALKSVLHGEGLPVSDTHMKITNARSSSQENKSESVQPVEGCIQEQTIRITFVTRVASLLQKHKERY